jgi:hypothetical protein
MLGYLLAVLVGGGSAGLYIAAFFFPEIHRKPDFIWGGVGLFYALVLWIYAPELTGGILVGQAASVALLGWFGWQTVKLRQLVPIDWQTSLPITKTPERIDTKQANPTRNKPAAKKPNGSPDVSRSTTATTSDSPAVKPVIEQKPQPTTPAAKSTPKPAPGNESVRVEIGTSAPAKPPLTRIIPDTSIEQDDEAWIRLEVKPSPDASTLIKEVTRSTRDNALQPTPPAKSQPIQTTNPSPASAKPQPDRSIPAPPPPPPATPQPLPEQPSKQTNSAHPEVVTPKVPAVPVKPVAEVTPPPALLAAAKPLGEATQPPTTPPQKIEAVPAKTEHPHPQQVTPTANHNAPTEQTGDLDRLIAELESEI